MQVRIQSLFLTSALLLTEVRIFSGPYLEKKQNTFVFNSLQTVNGVSTVGNVSTMLNHFITEQDFLTKEGQDILFTLVVVYDLTEDGSRLDEKILNTAVYKVSNQQAVTGFLTTPAAISTISAYNIGVSYTINSGPDDLGLFDWTITKSISGLLLQ
jgi:hypothetical protein